MEHRHVARETPRADAHEADAVAMARIHVRLDLEDEAGEIRALGRNRPLVAHPRARWWAEIEKRVQENFDAEIGERRTEEDRRDLAAQEFLPAERFTGAVEQIDIVLQTGEQLRIEISFAGREFIDRAF